MYVRYILIWKSYSTPNKEFNWCMHSRYIQQLSCIKFNLIQFMSQFLSRFIIIILSMSIPVCIWIVFFFWILLALRLCFTSMVWLTQSRLKCKILSVSLLIRYSDKGIAMSRMRENDNGNNNEKTSLLECKNVLCVLCVRVHHINLNLPQSPPFFPWLQTLYL